MYPRDTLSGRLLLINSNNIPSDSLLTPSRKTLNLLASLISAPRRLILSELEIFPPTAGPQNERWQSFNGHLYYFSTTTADWQTSRNDCLSKGADLVVINDAAENDFARGLNRKAWMGLKKSGSTWTWVDGSILLPSYWGPGEPNNQLNLEDRAEIGFFANSVNSWNDAPGTTSNYWICEKEVV
uniref:C-type lectin domain-containing protein n=1 Tax=Oryzias latipes TaxID=8090 RepID=A0A3P9IJZ1_ORYLA